MKVTYRKLGREKIWGIAHSADKSIELDSRLNKKKHLEVLIHEAMHHLKWDLSETKIINHSRKLANLIWKEKYRKCDV